MHSRSGFLRCEQGLPALRLPAVTPVSPVVVTFLPDLTRRAGKLESGLATGVAVHAGSFLRERRIVLESALLSDRSELRRILIHELFHFVWMRLGNTRRSDWAWILAAEGKARARGELGWSAETRKRELSPPARERQTQAWRDYLCESFCDTAAWRYSDLADHDEFTLAHRWRSRRAAFFEGLELRPLAL